MSRPNRDLPSSWTELVTRLARRYPFALSVLPGFRPQPRRRRSPWAGRLIALEDRSGLEASDDAR